MKLYMVNYKNSSLLAISEDQKNFIVPGLLENCPDYLKSIENFLNHNNGDLEVLFKYINIYNIKEVNILEKDILPPISRPKQNIICMGLNYEDHIKESEKVFLKDIKRPKHPIIFTKSSLSINSPFGEIPLREEISEELDWESELAIVIGKPGIHIKKEHAYNHIFGYMVLNDVSARDIQRKHKQFFLGKSLPGACPIGPCIVSKDEIKDPHNLNISCRVNNILKQNSNTKYQLFNIAEQVETISKSTYLVPGDIIATGTPSGVGFARNPPEFLKDGDIVECEVEKIGKIINKVVDYSYQKFSVVICPGEFLLCFFKPIFLSSTVVSFTISGLPHNMICVFSGDIFIPASFSSFPFLILFGILPSNELSDFSLLTYVIYISLSP